MWGMKLHTITRDVLRKAARRIPLGAPADQREAILSAVTAAVEEFASRVEKALPPEPVDAPEPEPLVEEVA